MVKLDIEANGVVDGQVSGLWIKHDSGNPFHLDTEKGCDSEDACRCANELVHELTESKKRSGRQSAALS